LLLVARCRWHARRLLLPIHARAPPAATVGTTLGATMSPPETSVATRPCVNTVTGTDRAYKGDGQQLLFRIYFDPSSTDATSLFAKVEMLYETATPWATKRTWSGEMRSTRVKEMSASSCS
jgi:hypothetical protein